MMNNSSQIQYPEIAKEIIRMCEEDQKMRSEALESDGVIESKENLDEKNAKRMREIVFEIRWPSISKVGRNASHDAWLLVQHFDHDVPFQFLCLSLMNALPNEEVSRADIAMLTDRIRVNTGEPQVYGTQFIQINARHVPKPIEDLEHLEERRKRMGLDTLGESIERMYRKYPFKPAEVVKRRGNRSYTIFALLFGLLLVIVPLTLFVSHFVLSIVVGFIILCMGYLWWWSRRH